MRIKMTPEEVRNERLDTFARMLRKVDRTLTGRDIHCKRVEGALPNGHYVQAPAVSNGNTIYFNSKMIGDLSSPEEVIVLNGLNYHELCHILYTPRTSGNLRTLMADGYGVAYNALEDQRIESMFVSLYPGTKPYFTLTAMRHILGDPRHVERAFPLTWGRRYLGGEVRDNLATLYPNQSVVSEVKAIIDEYRTLILPKDTTRACALVRKYGDLLGLRHDSEHQSDPYQHNGDTPRTEGRTESASQQKEAQEWREEEDADQEEQDKEDQQSGKSDGGEEESEDQQDQQDGQEDGQEDDQEDGDQGGEDTEEGGSEGEGEDEEGDGDSDGDGESTAQQGQGDLDDDRDGDGDGDGDQEGDDSSDESDSGGRGGDGASKGNKNVTQADVEKKMQEAVEELMADPEVQADTADKLRVLQRGDNDTTAIFDTYRSVQTPVTPQMRNVSKKITNQFQRLVRDLDPGFHTHRSTGRVNMGRAMRGDDIDTVFDQWDEGKFDASDIEMVVMVDLSGSMSNQMDATSQALWVIVNGVRSIGNTVRVQALGFETSAWNLYKPHEAHSKTMYSEFGASGGTSAYDNVVHARSVFRKSQKAHKILVTISDGGWVDAYDADPVMKEMTDAGVLTGAFQLDVSASLASKKQYFENAGRPEVYEKYEEELRHNAKFFQVGTTITDLIPLVTTMVKHAMQG